MAAKHGRAATQQRALPAQDLTAKPEVPLNRSIKPDGLLLAARLFTNRAFLNIPNFLYIPSDTQGLDMYPAAKGRRSLQRHSTTVYLS